MIKKIIKETWFDFMTMFIVVGIGVFIASLISWYFLFFTVFIGIVLMSKPYAKIRLIQQDATKRTKEE